MDHTPPRASTAATGPRLAASGGSRAEGAERSAVALLRECLDGIVPRIAFVLGSGVADFADEVEDPVVFPYDSLEGWPTPSVGGHRGRLVCGRIADVPVVVLQGRAHYYEHGDAQAMRRPIADLAELGVETLVLTNAAGSIREAMPPGSIMLIEDHINWSGTNPLVGEDGDHRFVDMSGAYDPGHASLVRKVATDRGIHVRGGVYMWFSGPSFETPAEIRMAMAMGADAVGMSTVPETILARRFGLRVAALSVITNMGAGLSDERLSHEHTQEQARMAGRSVQVLLREIARTAGRGETE